MCQGIAVAYSEFPLDLIEQYRLDKRIHDRGGEREVRFLYRDARPALPVWYDGQLRLVRWGSRRGQTVALPATGYTWLATVEAGGWAAVGGVEVLIPATLGLENGVWYRIRQGIRGVLVEDESGRPCVYLMVEPASHYYRTMTKSTRMPVLVGERI